MYEENVSAPYKRGFLILVAIIVVLTVILALAVGRGPIDILAYLGFTTGITYIFFG
ncbi:MAG: hypothetical protein OXI77_03650 [Chloroflexota bacterium]|nr:hypothetical protein [Chloroflexota bacterium]MDE2908385.1 hypothetical protein [Chloroflexota bacterium]